ncbi:prepilin-type N-terminal cleavage/methylation domain-containing protein [Candidatus Nomurabacteria bacterium]|nr:prepilin-type N-terminal cleavage/methylation domain-containing protein [Candidatus Nomurabacteria bacterium]
MTNRGFTLIEMLVSVLLLTLAIGGPLTISGKGLLVALVAKDQTIAFYLAQDAVEYVRYARDTNSLGGGNWLSGVGATNGVNLTPCISSTGATKCYLNTLGAGDVPTVPTACPSNVCSKLYYNNTTKNYTYTTTGGNTPSIFTRSIAIQNPVGAAANEAILSVTVSWSDIGNNIRSITVTETLFDWQ